MTHSETYLAETAQIAKALPVDDIERLARALHTLREINGRLFVIGLGGSFANAEHLAADFRKLCEIEAYAPNVPEMSAWINDAGTASAFNGFLNWAAKKDALLVLSVGGGTLNVSHSLMVAIIALKQYGAQVYAIVGPEGGVSAQKADICIKVPAAERVTPHTEAFQAVIWHLLVSHPLLQKNPTKW